MIEIEALHKYFNKGKQNEIHVINDITLSLPERGMVAIFGKSGCGKTTLLNVLGGLDTYSSGTVTVDGNDIRRDTDAVRNKYVGYIFQNYNLNQEETCFENVADALYLCGFTDKPKVEERVMAALKNVGMEKYRLRTPDTLSGGQQQRIAIARAIVKNPRIVLADEPTGNLDEANTVIIMELLRQIAKEHLVLLVTHEADLVDYYCDTVIELSDGKVVNRRTNETVGGYSARDKNDVFLGELTKSELKSDEAQIEYYGEKPQEPIKLKIVCSGGKTYLRVDTPKIRIIDETSEVRLREGVFKHEEHGQAASAHIDMSALPPIESSKCGRLFTFGASLKSGYRANFKKGKKGKRFLRMCMGLFAAVFVLVSAFFGTAFNDLLKAKRGYNHNVFYVNTPNGEMSDALLSAVGTPESGIDYIRLDERYIPSGDSSLQFNIDFFETFSAEWNLNNFMSHAVWLDETQCRNLPCVLGKTVDLSDNEMVITTAVADDLLQVSSVGFITEYADLIGLTTSSLRVDNKNMRIVGIVKSSESAAYISEISMAKYILADTGFAVYRAADYGVTLQTGEIFYLESDYINSDKAVQKGDKMTLHGRELTVVRTARGNMTYEEWRIDNQKGKEDYFAFEKAYIDKRITAEYPDVRTDFSDFPDYPNREDYRTEEEYNSAYAEYESALEEIGVYGELADRYREQYYFEIRDEYLTDFDEYLTDRNTYECDEVVWWAVMKKLPGARAMAAQLCSDIGAYTDSNLWCYADFVRAHTGEYPTYDDALSAVHGAYSDIRAQLYEQYHVDYSDEWKQSYKIAPVGCYISDTDCIAIAKRFGNTSNALRTGATGRSYYTLVHSTDPEKTEAYLKTVTAHVTGKDDEPVLVTPEAIRKALLRDKRAGIFTNLIALAVILTLMCLCMYFIFRSSFLSRIKEVGVYRAIGASKRNLVFKFFTEALVLTLLTVGIGYLLMSLFMATLASSALVSTVLYYPVWLALGVLVLLMGASLLCGVLPVFMLLRKTPAAILAKYDI